jgi:tetratricopeptide (TPR) repeat protein
MPKHPVDPAQDIPDLSDEAYDAPSLDETALDDGGVYAPPPGRRGAALKLAIAAAIVLVVGAALLLYRGQHRRTVLASGMSKADALLRLDTDAGYRQAATLLEPLAEMDPAEAAAVRAFALAMRFADYRVAGAEAKAEALLVGPARAEVVPVYAHLAVAALALGRREIGNSATAAARAGDGPWANALKARNALAAGNVPAALEPASAAASSGSFAPGLALRGDVLRRLGKDPAAARAAYGAALSASPLHPRAAYGLAKLALSGRASADEAALGLQRLLDDHEGTPAPERGRAALHLASLLLRSGNTAAARAALDAAGLEGPVRGWAERAAAVAAERRAPYRAVAGAPVGLQSASDDDPGELSAMARAEPKAAKAKAAAKRTAAKKAAAKASAKKAASKKKAPRRRR